MQPLLSRLHERGAAIDVLAPAWSAPLLSRMPEVAQIIANPFGHGEFKLSARRRLGRQLAAAGYEHAFVLPNSWKSALVPFFAGIAKRTGYTGEARIGLLNDRRPLDKAALPLLAERYAALAEPTGAPLWARHPRVFLDVLKTGEALCPYCGTKYRFTGEKPKGHH